MSPNHTYTTIYCNFESEKIMHIIEEVCRVNTRPNLTLSEVDVLNVRDYVGIKLRRG